MKRRLSLKGEHLTELTRTDLAGIAGGLQQPPTDHACWTGYYQTLESPCDSVQVCIVIERTPLCPVTTR